jgi:signal transduction histidine kinase
MIGQAEIALKKERDSTYYRNVIQTIFQESLRLKHIVNSLLHLSKASKEVVGKTLENLRLDELVLDVVENLIQAERDRKIDVRLSFPAEREPMISGNRSLLEVAIGNILENACKFSDNQPVLCELKRSAGNFLELSIADSGIGMSVEEIERVSEPFFRSVNAREKEGFGIGMAVAARVFQVHQVEMYISSIQGSGTKINLLFPENPFPHS